MNNFDFKKIIAPLKTINLSEREKGSLRLRISDHMRNHPAPIQSRLSFSRVFPATILSLIIIASSGSLITVAAEQSLPGQFLYPIKRTNENIITRTIHSPEKKINYSLSLIEKRYTETNQLLTRNVLNDTAESLITADIENHIKDIQKQTETITQTNPAEALSYNTKLAQILKTNTQVFLAISEKNQPTKNQQLTSPKNHAKIVLSAYENTAKISLKTEHLQQVVLSDTDVITIKTAEKKYRDILPKIAEVISAEQASPILEVNPKEEKLSLPEIKDQENEVKVTIEKKDIVSPKSEATIINKESNAQKSESDTVTTLAKKLDDAYTAKKYNRVIVLADQIDQIISETKKIKAAELKYDIIVVPIVIESNPTPTNDSISTEIKPTIDEKATSIELKK
jgi:hypothetical protein